MEKEEMLENLKNDVNETIGLYESFITGAAIATRNMIERIGEVATLEKLADYTVVDATIEKVPSDLTIYTEETVKVLNEAVAAVKRG